MTTAPSTSLGVGSRVTRSQSSQGSHSSECSKETRPPGQIRARDISGVAKGITLGLDLGDKSHAFCALDTEGRILKQDTVANTPAALKKLLQRHPQARVVFEVTHIGIDSTKVSWSARVLSPCPNFSLRCDLLVKRCILLHL